jgi:hypothetical protein
MASLSLDIKVSVRMLSWFLCIAGTFILSILVNHFLSRKVKTIDMVEYSRDWSKTHYFVYII